MATSNSDIAGRLDIRARSGDTFIRDFTFTNNEDPPGPVSFQNYTARLQIRESAAKAPVLSATLSNYITIHGAGNNVISIRIPGENMKFPAKVYMWDLELISPDNITITYLRGTFKLEQDITQ